jgi:hypothetical protein
MCGWIAEVAWCAVLKIVDAAVWAWSSTNIDSIAPNGEETDGKHSGYRKDRR